MSLVRGRKESKLVRSLVLYVKLGVRFLAAVATRTPNRHIPLISTLFRPLQGVNGVKYKIKHHPFPSGIPLLLKIMQLFYKAIHRSQEGKSALA